jgi:hypothetical protein
MTALEWVAALALNLLVSLLLVRAYGGWFYELGYRWGS